MKALALLGRNQPLISRTSPSLNVNGAAVAGSETELALLTHGFFDRYDIVVPTLQKSLLESYHNELLGAGVDMSRVRLVLPGVLAESLSTTDYIAVHDPQSPYIGRLAAMVHPVTPHPTPCTCVHFSISYGSLYPVFADACCGIATEYDAMFCTSRDSCDAQRNIYSQLCSAYGLPGGAWNHRLELHPLGVNWDAFYPRIARKEARRLLGLPRDGTWITYVGRMTDVDKADLRILIRCLARLQTQAEPDPLYLLLAGADRGYSRVVREYAARLGVGDRLFVLGNITPLEKTLVLWASDIFTSPADSVQESFGIAVVEAMSAGLPVVVSDWGGYRDIVQDGDGYLIHTASAACMADIDVQAEMGLPELDHLPMSQAVVVDETQLAMALGQLARDQALRVTMGNEGRRHAQRFDWRQVVAQYEESWMNLKSMARGASRLTQRRVSLGRAFAHYPSRMITGDDRVRLAATTWPQMEPPPALAHLWPREVRMRIVRHLHRGEAMVREVATSQLETRCLLWLAKHGVVEICAAV
jgi:glycosyltransferase involved in cell wall biosynthesis